MRTSGMRGTTAWHRGWWRLNERQRLRMEHGTPYVLMLHLREESVRKNPGGLRMAICPKTSARPRPPDS